MYKIRFYGCNAGMRKIPFTMLLNEKFDISLTEARTIKEKVVDGETVELTSNDKAQAKEIIRKAKELGVKCELIMNIKDILGCTIKDIRVKLEYEAYGLDKCDSFIYLDNGLIIDIPFSQSEEVWITDNDKDAESIDKHWHDKVFNKKIVNFISYKKDSNERGFWELENGYLITENNIAPHGVAGANLFIYHSLEELQLKVKEEFVRTDYP